VDPYLDTVAGLPVHALVVHAVVVLVPLAAVGAVLMALRPSFSRRFGVLVVIVAGVAVPAALVAKESGERLARRIGVPVLHQELGSVMPWVAAALFLGILVFWLVDRGIPMNRQRPLWLKLLAALLVLAAVGATLWTVRVGHSGATAVWTPILDGATPVGG
jgi:hypothetical protein